MDNNANRTEDKAREALDGWVAKDPIRREWGESGRDKATKSVSASEMLIGVRACYIAATCQKLADKLVPGWAQGNA